MSETGGTIDRELIGRLLDDLWRPVRSPVPRILFRQWPQLWPPEPDPGFCQAKLFAPDESLVLAVRAELIITGTPVHPGHVAYLDRAQGPRPAVCAREPHPDSSWHWDGRGTWWR